MTNGVASALLDDCSERSMLLNLKKESPPFTNSPGKYPGAPMTGTNFPSFQMQGTHKSTVIDGAFTARSLSLTQHTYPLEPLQKKCKHHCGLSIPALEGTVPFRLLSSGQAHLITPVEPVRLGTPCGPAAVYDLGGDPLTPCNVSSLPFQWRDSDRWIWYHINQRRR